MNTLPSLFVSHGAPTFAIEPERAGAQLRALGRALRKPRAVVVVSPHWMTRGVEITASARPDTIHDFGGFPRALYALRYAAPGSPELAQRVQALLHAQGVAASLDARRGLDHGAWVPLLHLLPEADVPVLQVSLPFDTDAGRAFALGRALAPLAREGVLVIGSGSLTHNLYEFRPGDVAEAPYAREFTLWIRQAVLEGDADRLLHALDRAPHAARAHPSSEHFLPLLVAAGAAPALLPATVLDGGIRHGVLAMESYAWGAHIALAGEGEDSLSRKSPSPCHGRGHPEMERSARVLDRGGEGGEDCHPAGPAVGRAGRACAAMLPDSMGRVGAEK